MITRKPRMLISVTKADKTARIVWAVLTTKQDYRAPMVSG
jgi:transposase